MEEEEKEEEEEEEEEGGRRAPLDGENFGVPLGKNLLNHLPSWATAPGGKFLAAGGRKIFTPHPDVFSKRKSRNEFVLLGSP